jgi:hypothetical protein
MPDHDKIRAGAHVADMVRRALALADEAGMPIVAIHLEDALAAIVPAEEA